MTGNSPSEECSVLSSRGQHPAYAVRDHSGAARDVPPGEAQDAVTGNGEPPVTVAIRLERAPSAVGRAAIHLDDESGVRPQEVDHVLEQRDVHFRLGKVALAAEREESLLEIVACRR